MVWTVPTALVFAGLVVLLAAMAVWGRISPPVARRGFLRIETDRGDRLYIGLISAAVVLAGWIAVTDLSMWLALGCALLVALVIGRWG
ncbi:putative small integral membrane protein [Nonomuraea fuscirosea]|uniref:Putative small integral membrane protein n=2 Tax=Nonomuraea fuscirosea TaxID=1291556 RepID=A0A2T0M495_9ACTN|nr:putative small integral membrane protein [Nonomuraea fuscirosea]